MDSLESQIAATEDQITVDTAKSLELKSMQAAIEDYQAAGRSQIVMPAYDNITPPYGLPQRDARRDQ